MLTCYSSNSPLDENFIAGEDDFIRDEEVFISSQSGPGVILLKVLQIRASPASVLPKWKGPSLVFQVILKGANEIHERKPSTNEWIKVKHFTWSRKWKNKREGGEKSEVTIKTQFQVDCKLCKKNEEKKENEAYDRQLSVSSLFSCCQDACC